jgi:hypothetical protein
LQVLLEALQRAEKWVDGVYSAHNWQQLLLCPPAADHSIVLEWGLAAEFDQVGRTHAPETQWQLVHDFWVKCRSECTWHSTLSHPVVFFDIEAQLLWIT